MNRYLRDVLTFPADARRAWRLEGWSGPWGELADRTIRRVYRRGRMVIVEQLLDDLPHRAPPAGVHLREIGVTELPLLRTLTTRRTLDRFASYFAHGGWCLLATRDDTPIGYTWIAGRMLPGVESIPIELPRDAAYGWALYVLPSERSSGVGSALVSARLRLARDRGFRAAWRAIRVTNEPALRTLRKTSGRHSRLVEEVSYLKLFRSFRMRSRPVTVEADAAG